VVLSWNIVKTAPQFPTRRALAGIAIVSALSAIERHQKQKAQENPDLAVEDMSGELQTIPARHGVATFVPRGRTIKVINTYGKQVVSMWAFSLGPPPEEGEDAEGEEEVDEEKVKEEAEGLKNAVEGKGDEGNETAKEAERPEEGEESGKKETESTSKDTDKSKQDDDDDPPEQAPPTPENEKTSESTAKQPVKRTWGSYLPSIPYRNKGAPKKPEEQKASAQDEKTQNEANTKKWSSYLPTGKGFSSYVPNVQIPDSKAAVSAFKSTHSRDPNKSYAEQLYDFSKTPVGAGTIAGKQQITFFPRVQWSHVDERWNDD
jgi:hypothetical protein